MDHLIVCNTRNVSDHLEFKVAEGDILNNTNCKSFIEKYKKYFENVSIESFKMFTNETGLTLSIIYLVKNSINEISFNALGSSLDNPFKRKIYNHDLCVINYADNIVIKNDKVIIDGKETYILNNNQDVIHKEKLYYQIRFELCFADTIQEKEKIIYDKYDKNYKLKENVKQIYLSSFGDLFVLYEDGVLYKNNKKYAENVLGIWDANSYVCYLIFKDYHLEYLSTSYMYSYNKKYDKIIYNNKFIGLLKNKNLEVISISEEPDTNYHAFFSNVDDISFSDNDIDINLEVDSKKIVYGTNSFMENYE